MKFPNASDYSHVGFTTEENVRDEFLWNANFYGADTYVTTEYDMGVIYHLWVSKKVNLEVVAVLESIVL